MAKKTISPIKNESSLMRAARLWANRQGQDYDNGAEGAINDLMHGGCQSGMVSELIYYTDTVKFFKKHKKEISELLQEMCDDCGCRPDELLRDWDKSDPLAMETHNQNLLAWFGFEESARRVADAAGIEV